MPAQDPRITELAKQVEALNEQNRQAFDKEDEARRTDANYVMPADERKAVIDRNKKIEALEHEIKDVAEMAGIRLATGDRKKALEAPVTTLPMPGRAAPANGQPKTLGERFVGSAEWAALKARFPQGIPDGAKFTTDPVQVGSLLPARATLVTGDSATSAGALVVADREPDIMRIPFAIISIFDVISRRSTDSDLVEYVRQTSRTNAAAPTAEATATAGASGTKPESAFALAVVQEPVKTIAHWIPATRRALADASQVRGMIDDELRDGLLDKLADQIINGDGVGENFTGIANVADLTAQAFVDDVLATTRKARTAARTTGKVRPTAYLMNPSDWEAIELSQDAELRYYYGGPSVLTAPRLWGLPVVEEDKVTAGSAYTGDLRLATLWDRQLATIYTSDSHSDFFIRNIVAILAEQRAAFGVRRPAGIVEIDLTA